MTTTPTLWGDRIIVSASNSAIFPSSATLASGGFAVVWEDSGNLFGQKYDFTGVARGGDFLSGISGIFSGDLGSPEAVELANGDVAVAYTVANSPTDHDVLVATDGGAGIGFLDLTNHDDYFINDVERTQDGGFAVLWQRNTPGDGNDPVILQRVNSDGVSVGSEIIVDPTSAESQSDGDLTLLTNGNLVVTWRTFNFTSNTSTLLMEVYSAQGSPLTGEIPFAPTINPAFSQVEALANGNFVAVWQDVNVGGIYHRVFDENGDTVSIRHFYNAGGGILPKAAALVDGGYILAWSDFGGPKEGDGSPDGNITIQRFDSTGGTVGGPLIIADPGDQSLADMKTLSDGRVLLTYTNETGDSTNVDTLVYQIIDPRDSTITGTTGGDKIVGRVGDSVISGLEGDDNLVGLAGDDELLGNSGNDRLDGGSGDDDLNGGSNADFLKGSEGDDVIYGASGDDQLFGGDDVDHLYGQGGVDVLSGGAGRDVLFGGGGADFFDYNTVGESGVGVSTRDRIRDFTQGEDVIDLSTIDAAKSPVGDQAFVFIGSAAFSAEGQVRFVQSGEQTLVQANVKGAGGAEITIALDGLLTLTAADFVL